MKQQLLLRASGERKAGAAARRIKTQVIRMPVAAEEEKEMSVRELASLFIRNHSSLVAVLSAVPEGVSRLEVADRRLVMVCLVCS